MLERGVAEKVFPAAQAVVIQAGKTAFEGAAGDASLETVFDLASLTKILCTTALFMTGWEKGELAPTDSLRDLLYHRSGLPAFLPFFEGALRAFPELIQATCASEIRNRARQRVIEEAKLQHPLARAGVVTRYSDIGFILLGDQLERRLGKRLDALFLERIGRPLGLGARFRPLEGPQNLDAPYRIAPTGRIRPRPPAPGQEGLWNIQVQAPSPAGEVDDDNAWAMGGVAGHAGLFGTAWDLAKFGQAVLEDLEGAGRMASSAIWRQAIQVDSTLPGSTRALGFDTPNRTGTSSAGRLLGNGPLGAVGHLGFTGVSLWIDLSRQLVVALCSNRTYLGRDNLLIHSFRPRFHDAAVRELEPSPSRKT